MSADQEWDIQDYHDALRRARYEIARLTERCDAYVRENDALNDQLAQQSIDLTDANVRANEAEERCDAYREALCSIERGSLLADVIAEAGGNDLPSQMAWRSARLIARRALASPAGEQKDKTT